MVERDGIVGTQRRNRRNAVGSCQPTATCHRHVTIQSAAKTVTRSTTKASTAFLVPHIRRLLIRRSQHYVSISGLPLTTFLQAVLINQRLAARSPHYLSIYAYHSHQRLAAHSIDTTVVPASIETQAFSVCSPATLDVGDRSNLLPFQVLGGTVRGHA